MSENANIADSSNAPSEWLRPEFAILQRRFDDWKRELRELTRSGAGSDSIAAVLNEPIRRVEWIADTIDGELNRFWQGEITTAEPENLRRLLTHGQQHSAQLQMRFSSLHEMQRVCDGLVFACEGMLHEHTVDDRIILGLIDSLRESAAAERPWTLWDPAFTDVSSAAVRRTGGRIRNSLARVLAVGVPAGRLVARVAYRLDFSPREAVAAIYAALFQDCGYLLPCDRSAGRTLKGASRHRRIDPAFDDRVDAVDAHPRYGAALAAGLASIPTESLAAIAVHHAAVTPTAKGESSRLRRVDHLVAVVSEIVAALLHDGLRQSNPRSPLELQTTVGGFESAVAAAMDAELALATMDTDFSPAMVATDDFGAVPAPRFLQVSPRTADLAPRVS